MQTHSGLVLPQFTSFWITCWGVFVHCHKGSTILGLYVIASSFKFWCIWLLFFSFSVCIYVAHMTYIEMFKVVIFCYFYFRHRLFKTKYSTREFMQLTELVQFFLKNIFFILVKLKSLIFVLMNFFFYVFNPYI